MTNLSKLNDILELMGYDITGEIDKFSVNETIEGVDISFRVTKRKEQKPPTKISIDVPAVPVVSKETFGEYCDRVETESKKKVLEKSEVKETNRWATPIPRTFARYIFFKSHKEAEKFATEYEKDFAPIDKDKPINGFEHQYKISKNKSDQELFEKGFGYILNFRMNGADFEVLESCEQLKKKEGCGLHGSTCIRYKE